MFRQGKLQQLHHSWGLRSERSHAASGEDRSLSKANSQGMAPTANYYNTYAGGYGGMPRPVHEPYLKSSKDSSKLLRFVQAASSRAREEGLSFQTSHL